MLRKIPQLILFVLAWSAAPTEAGPYLFSFSGTAVPLTDNDALTGAFVEFAFIIDSDAIADDQTVPGEDDCAVAWYSSSILEPTLTISGSLASDGMYDAEGPFTMTVADTDVFFEDIVKVTQNSGGVFDVPGTNGIYVSIFLWDPSTDALDGIEVPIDISLDDFHTLEFKLKTPEGGSPLGTLFNVPDFDMTITPVPEPGSLFMLALGGIGIVVRRRAGI